jgi:hypothetical protein
MPPNFALLDISRPEVARLIAAMVRARDAVEHRTWSLELAVQIVRQRAIVKHALDTGQGSEMAESLLDALEGSIRIFEKHRIFLLSCSVNGYAGHPAPRPARGLEPAGRDLPRRNGSGAS